ncbi:MAG: TldD/PmbA family protein [Conexivisphaera sp.]
MDRLVRSVISATSPEGYVVLLFSGEELRVKFYNNRVAISEIESADVAELYAVKSGRHALVSVEDLSDRGIEDAARALRSALEASPQVGRPPLPPPSVYEHNGDFDPRTLEYDAPSLVESAVSSALSSGARRVAGVLELGRLRASIRTSSGVDQSDDRSYALLNVRAFADEGGQASGQGISVSTTPRRLDPAGAGRSAAELARLAASPCSLEPGTYDVIFAPTSAADLVQHVGAAASAYSVLSGFSFLEGRIGERVAPEWFSLVDHGQIVDGVGSRSFDDEGTPTRTNAIIERGTLRTYLHNTVTGAEFGVGTTGNAGLIEPEPRNLEVSPGDSSLDEMVREVRRGLLVTSNWYTRFQNYRTGDYSTLPRDATPVIENGEFRCSARGIRVSSNLLRDLGNLSMASRERRWVKWWEVEVPVLTPHLLVRGVRITAAL